MEHNGSAMRAKSLGFLILLPISLLMIIPCQVSAHPCKFPAIFNFGDSNSDTGGWSAAFGQAGPPHGETFFHAPAGRYSDGRLIIDFIAEKLGLSYLHSFLDSMGSNFSHGANFATAASTIRHQNSTGFSPFSLNVQYHQFNDFKRRSKIFRSKGKGNLFGDLLPRAEYFSQALYTFDIGHNDVSAGFFSNMSTNEVKASFPDILNQLTTYVKSIYDVGGRYFWIHNTGPLGCLTYLLDRLTLNPSHVDQAGCAIPLNELTQYFNIMLKKAVDHLRQKMPLAVLTYVDIYSVKYDLFSQAHKYGFEHPLMACCGHGAKNNFDPRIGCGLKIKVNGTEVKGKACKDPSVRIIWDGVHFTEAANKWVFNRIVNGSFSDPRTPLTLACYRQS